MNTPEIIIAILLSIGAFQGTVYGVVLLTSKKGNRRANRFLAAILLFFAYRLVVEVLQLFGLGYYDFWYHILLEYNWIYGALIYFFIRALVQPSIALSSKDWIHFIPVALEFLWSNFIKVQNFYWDGTRESLSWLGYWGYIIWMQYPTMIIICGLLIVHYSYTSEKLLSSALQVQPRVTEKDVAWVRRLLLVLRYYALLGITITLVDFFFFDYAFDDFYSVPVFIGLAVITYWMGILGFQRRKDFLFKSNLMLHREERAMLENLSTELNELMTADKIFKNPELNLSSLAEQLQVKPYMLTKCLHHVYGKKFNYYINELRVSELKRMLQAPENANLTLLALAFEVGFNSKASFNRAVKNITGKSPKALKSAADKNLS